MFPFFSLFSIKSPSTTTILGFPSGCQSTISLFQTMTDSKSNVKPNTAIQGQEAHFCSQLPRPPKPWTTATTLDQIQRPLNYRFTDDGKLKQAVTPSKYHQKSGVQTWLALVGRRGSESTFNSTMVLLGRQPRYSCSNRVGRVFTIINDDPGSLEYAVSLHLSRQGKLRVARGFRLSDFLLEQPASPSQQSSSRTEASQDCGDKAPETPQGSLAASQMRSDGPGIWLRDHEQADIREVILLEALFGAVYLDSGHNFEKIHESATKVGIYY